MDQADADDTTPSAAQYPALGEMPDHRHLTACETLCWLGYGRPIPWAVYFAPIFRGPNTSLDELPALLHRSVPDQKPAECPMDDAERILMENLRAGRIQALFKNDGRFVSLPAEAYDYALVVNVRGGIEVDAGASCRDQENARQYVVNSLPSTDVFFRTSEVLRLLPAWPVRAPNVSPVKRIPVPWPKQMAWWKGYVQQHSNPDLRPTKAKQYAAAKAHFSDYAPPTHINMQDLRALPDTPSEWREPGRRPKL